MKYAIELTLDAEHDIEKFKKNPEIKKHFIKSINY